MWTWERPICAEPPPARSGSRGAAALGLALVAAGCGGGAAPTPASPGQPVELGPFTVTVSRTETVPLPGGSAETEDTGLALFVELEVPPPPAEVASRIAALRERESEVGSAIANGRSTQRNFDDSQLTEELEDLLGQRERLEEEAFHGAARNRLLRRAIHVVDADGEDHHPSGYVTRETYERQMRFRRGSAEDPFRMLAASRENAGYAAGATRQQWVLFFRVPPRAAGLAAVLTNTDRRKDQPRVVRVPLGGA